MYNWVKKKRLTGFQGVIFLIVIFSNEILKKNINLLLNTLWGRQFKISAQAVHKQNHACAAQTYNFEKRARSLHVFFFFFFFANYMALLSLK